jgi:hypothetical protein
MDAFALPFIMFTAGLVWLLVEVIRGSFEDPYPLRAGVTWAVTCPTAGLLFGIGMAPLGLVVATVSALALGSLAWWFLGTESDDTDDNAEEPVEPDPGPSDDEELEIPAWARRVEPATDPASDIDWDAFDRLREAWERTPAIPAPAPQRAERASAGL